MEGGKCAEQAHCIGYKAGFKSEQGHSNHERVFAMAQHYYKEKYKTEIECNQTLHTSNSTSTTFIHPPRKKFRENEHQERHNRVTNNLVFMQPPGTEDAVSNSHKSNRESSKRVSYNNEFKAHLIEFYEW